jgi:capsule biosynthesis phosphatase
MIFILLSGGIGKRCNNYSLPKPLNYIHGKHMIEYMIENIPSNEIYIIYNIFLDEYNFREIVVNKFKTKKFYFSAVDYLTRGAVETAYVGIQQFANMDNENIVFIDNDNLHFFHDLQHFENDFIGYSIDYKNTNYSFIKIVNNQIINIEEKHKISDHYCCGLYGFKNTAHFMKHAKQLIDSNYKTKNEFYFSQLYKMLLQNNETIEPFHIERTKHIGSYDEIIHENNSVQKEKLRICFDLDNTLVTYPTIPNDYSSVKPIVKNIQLLHNLKNNGHEIIIYTARRMVTHKNNIGKVIKDIALVTINSLEKYGIPYDELIFGKPIADIYIDDRAINPYINNISYFGLFYKDCEFIPNKIPNNKYNTIEKVNNRVIKTGPSQFMNGELFYYQNIPETLSHYFSKLIDFNKRDDVIELTNEFISGIPLFYLYKNKLITESIIDNLFIVLDNLHGYSQPNMNISTQDVRDNYFKKLQNRFNVNDYYFDDANIVFDEIVNGLSQYYHPKIVSIIHGDFWFSNILLTYDDNIKIIDMKGQVNNVLTLHGDSYYDYGKLYQSILGYDLILHSITIDVTYINAMKRYFLDKCKEKGLDLLYLKYVTKSLIFGTFHSIHDKKPVKQCIWNFLKSDLMNEL